jgi:hypothetical protein
MCAICGRLIGEGEGVRRITLSAESDALLTQVNCHDRDWGTIESGLEPFPLLFRQTVLGQSPQRIDRGVAHPHLEVEVRAGRIS